jgi:Glycosyl transferase family 2
VTAPSEIAVIVPTLARRERADLLQRALASVFDQAGVRVRPVVVVNGSEGDPALVARLEADERLDVMRLADADLPAAYRAGRARVTTSWFASLDDDDILLPDALATRLAAATAAPDIDVVVTNGICVAASGRRLVAADFARVAADPLNALADGNWLLPGAWLCRTATVGAELFAGMPRYLECTYLALQFAMRYRMHFVAAPTVEWSAGTPDSESGSPAYRLGQPDALKRLLELDLPPHVRACFRRRLAAAHHCIARHALASGRVGDAWRDHLRSLTVGRGSLQYLPYTLRLLRSIA